MVSAQVTVLMSTPAGVHSEQIVLVVDDDELVGRYTARVLANAGYRVAVVRDGREALALLASMDPGIRLVVSDVDMPGMSGIELAGGIAVQWPRVGVLLVSGGAPRRYDQPFLRKPFTPDDLVAAVRELLQHRLAAGA
jgi:DNA-binding NtrC family response regulator